MSTPLGWTMTTIGEIAKTQLGKMLSKKSKTGVGSRPYVRNKNVQWGRIDVSDVPEMDFTDEEFRKFRLQDGDLLVCEGGEVGRAAIWRGQIEECAFQKAIHRIRTSESVLPEYLLHLLRHYSDRLFFDPYVTGSTIRHLPQEDLRILPVPLAPLDEQRRIVDAIEEQFSRLDDAQGSLGQVRRRITEQRSSLVSAAFHGVDDRRSLEELVAPGGMTDGPFGSNLKSSHYTPTGPRVIRLQNIGKGEFIDERAHISVEHYTKLKKHAVVEGDLVVASLGTELPKSCVIPPGVAPAIVKADCIRVRLSSDFDPHYVNYALQRHELGRSVASQVHGVGRPRLGMGGIRVLTIPVRPLDEQRRVVAALDAQFSLLASLSLALDAASSRSSVLRKSILADAFNGRLATSKVQAN